MGAGARSAPRSIFAAGAIKFWRGITAAAAGEIDVIASRGKYVAFVEVKLRKSAAFAEAREFVTRAKQQRIIMTAELWLGETGCELQPRFDVVEIYAPDGESGRISIEHIADAFRCD